MTDDAPREPGHDDSPWWAVREAATTGRDAPPGRPAATAHATFPKAGAGPATRGSTASPTGLTASQARRGATAYGGRAAIDFGTTSATVTVRDTGGYTYPALSPAQVRRMAGELAALLDSAPSGPEELLRTWEEVRHDIAQRLAAADPLGSADATAADRLRADDGRGRILEVAVAELERVRTNRGPGLTRFLTPRLHRCYAAGLDVPPLDMLRYFRAYLDGTTTDEVRSVVYVTGQGGDHRYSLTRPDGVQPQDVVAYRGIKQQLGRRRPRLVGPPDGPGLPELVGGALEDLVVRTDRYLDAFRDELGLAPGVITDAVVTYPAMAPTSVRHDLRSWLEQRGLPKVDIRFDEAVAAAMFHVLCESGGLVGVSVEAFVARCRPVGVDLDRDPPARPTRWAQTVLIVDVGGGTTDVALLELDLRDETDRTVEGGDSPHFGHYFRLRPTLLGTTGESQRGGDWVTLQVFRWLKVLLADHLLVHEPDVVAGAAGGLDPRYCDVDGSYRPGSLVADTEKTPGELRTATTAAGRLVPTAWRGADGATAADAADREELFLDLWSLAEEAKKLLGRDDQVRIDDLRAGDEVTVRTLLRKVRERHPRPAGPRPPGAAGAGGTGVVLHRTTFERLVGDELALVMNLPAALVRDRLAGAAPDRVILTGRGALLPLVEQKLRQALVGRADDGRPVRQPVFTRYPEEYAKHAASIGACWAATLDTRRQSELRDQLAEGATILTVDVENLFRFLPASFVSPAPGQPDGETSLFRAGQELVPLEPDGEPMARSKGWQAYVNPFLVHRRKVQTGGVPVPGRETVNWAHFRVQDHLDAHPIPGFALEEGREADLRVRAEVTAALDMTALVCLGDQPEITLPRGCRTEDVSARLGEPGARPYATVPVDLAVNAQQGGSVEPPTAGRGRVFTRGEDFDAVLVVDGPDGRPERRRALVRGPLPAPHPEGWRFARPADDGEETGDVLVATIPVPAAAAGAAYHAVLDDQGELTVLAGEPPYRWAENLAEVFGSPGSVLRVPMTSDDPDYQETDDPFTGKQ